MRRDVRTEADYLPDARAVEDLADLHGRLVAAGHSPQVAGGIVSWLIVKADPDRDDPTAPPTRARYRKILAELDPPTRGPGGRPPRRLTVVAGPGGGVAAAAPREPLRRAALFAVTALAAALTHPRAVAALLGDPGARSGDSGRAA